ncbi:pyridoxal 5'-phosphate synthase glutaminase subunit PdxT [Candidatus Peregrinibacteria bacterium]|nr:MAG: pyridoxal 5'-phosphate synthase glutaminase subunit PdxT [Candidatus Peregrinibacteria bacterium]
MKVGILAIQGGFHEHAQLLSRLGVPFKEVRSLADVEGLTGFIIPGGESTVMDAFMQKYGLKDWLMQRAEDPSFTIFGTCAGLILLARYGLLDATVQRNAYGRQMDSFIAEVEVKGVGRVSGHFIRAPQVLATGPKVELLGAHDGVPVVLRQGKVWACSFHPELAGDLALHAAIFSC